MRLVLLSIVAAIAGWLLPSTTAIAESVNAEVVVYGDASGGVAAAVQSARMGKKVILVSQYGHLGGLTSSGLGLTDIGDPSILGGIAREFYHQLYLHYQDESAWVQESKSQFHNQGQGVQALDDTTQLASTFEPKVAEKVFDQLVAEAGITVIPGRLELEDGVERQGQSISAIRLEDGRLVRGAVFIDASYEGDLLAAAGVSYRVGREANAEYDETVNGVAGLRKGNQLPDGIDPYKTPGDASSGLLEGVSSELSHPVGAADQRLQAYCYRMVLTDVESNRVSIERPAAYDENDYEILFRAIEAGQQGEFFKRSLIPNRKTDSNNASGISCDWIGGNYGPDWNWATLDHEQRTALAAKHRDWQLGLVWTLQNHPRVPPPIKKRLSVWGMTKDEFADNGNWPYNIYVREARRMISNFVMTEQHCQRTLPVPDSVGMGAYTLDSHNVQRFVHAGMVKNEGDVQVRLQAGPYSISYRALVPRQNECDNLLVPWALSATHIAFGSIRMEPVFMVLGQSCGTAASLAIDEGIAVQELDYPKLREQLLKAGQVLEVESLGQAAPE